jgi:hypothetical protein
LTIIDECVNLTLTTLAGELARLYLGIRVYVFVKQYTTTITNKVKNMAMNAQNQAGPDQTVFFIDKEKFTVDVPSLTVKQLIEDYAKEDPNKTTLALKVGNDTPKYKDQNEVITLKNGMHFVLFHNEPTTVS